MTAQGNPVIPNMNFRLLMDGTEIPCKSIHGFRQETEEEYISEGGLNGYVHIRPRPASKPPVIEVERYVTENFTDPLPVGQALPSYLVLEVGGNLRFLFKGCTVAAKSYGELNAEKGGILVETTTISYQQMETENG